MSRIRDWRDFALTAENVSPREDVRLCNPLTFINPLNEGE
jgi:hypothetical protein